MINSSRQQLCRAVPQPAALFDLFEPPAAIYGEELDRMQWREYRCLFLAQGGKQHGDLSRWRYQLELAGVTWFLSSRLESTQKRHS